MHSLFRNGYRWRISFVLFWFLVSSIVSAQFVQTVNVMPPYSNKLSDYIAAPGKIQSVITPVSMGFDRLEYPVYVHGVLMSTDESFIIRTKQGYKPAVPILIKGTQSASGAIAFLPYTLTYSDVLQIFNEQNLEYIGITREQVMQQGLPENSYQVCFSMFDYASSRPLTSVPACSNMFTVSWVEPPIIISPVSQAVLNEPEAKNVVFIWTRPPGTPVNVQYKLRIIELNTADGSYQDKIHSPAYPVFFETIAAGNTYLYTVANPQFNPGRSYAFMVTAIDPANQTAFKNKGNSEPSVFSYPATGQVSAGTDSKFTFLIPRLLAQTKPDTLEVNSNQDLLLNWAWLKSITPDSTAFTDEETIQALGIEKYVLDISRKKSIYKTTPSFSFSRTFSKDQDGTIPNKLQLSAEDSENAGFTDGQTYTATIRQYGKTNNLIATYSSHDFVFTKGPEEGPMQEISIRAALKYSFKGFPEIYPVIKTDVIAEILVLDQGSVTGNPSPLITIKNRTLRKIASAAFTTDNAGIIDSLVKVPAGISKIDTLFCRLTIGNQYYVDEEFDVAKVSNQYDTLSSAFADFGELTARTYAYQLNLNVQKRFTSYFLRQEGSKVTVQHKEKTEAQQAMEKMKTQGVENTLNDKNQAGYYQTEMMAVAPGIPVILYREDKKPQIPAYEGDINLKTPASSGKITIVAKGMTMLEGGKSYAKFDRLLASNTEKYKILAVKDIDQWVNKQNQVINAQGVTKTVFKPATSSGAAKTAVQPVSYKYNPNTPLTPAEYSLLESLVEEVTTAGTSTTNFLDEDDYIAEPVEFGLTLPDEHDPNAYYRTVTADYDVVSCRPPTSVIRGRLLYTWKSDKSKLKRPLANTRFRVIVNYVDENNVSIGPTKSQYNNIPGLPGGSESYTFIPDNAGNTSEDNIKLSDQYATMAAGITDANGNFVIETVNMDYKGELGAGSVNHAKTSHSVPIETPGGGIKEQLEKEIGGGLEGFDQSVVNPWDDGSGFAFPSGLGLSGSGIKFGGSNFGTDNQSLGNQSSVNPGFNVSFDAGSNSFELKGAQLKNNKGMITGGGFAFATETSNAHGPNSSGYPQSGAGFYSARGASPEDEFESKHYSGFKRVFRIMIDGDAASYYYPSAEIIEVQPLENIETPIDLTHYVREFEMNVYPVETNEDNEKSSLSGMQVTLFRHLADKKKNMPQGEGDGKYTYAELMNPQYSSQDAASNTSKVDAGGIFNKKFEHVWSVVPTLFNGFSKKNFAPLRGLIQSRYPDYFIQASSFVDKSDKTYQATIRETPQVPQVAETDWANPVIPLVETDVVLTPLVSRALITVRDVKSGAVVTKNHSARVMLSKEQYLFPTTDFHTVPVDDYGKAEILATGDSPLDQYVADGPNPTNVYFFAGANGYRDSYDGVLKSFVKKGVQLVKDIGLSPSHTVTGTVRCPDEKSFNNSPGTVKAYIRVGTGKYYETNPYGYFQIPAPFIANDTLKVVPFDVAYFDTTYVFTAADAAKELVKLGDVNVYRRRHRIQFSITEKSDQIGPAKSIAGATIHLGDTVRTTDSNGTAWFNFENVSVNNYTFVVRGSPGSGYIPKTINLSSKETKDFVVKKVELEKGSEITGTVRLDGAPVKHARVYIDVSSTSSYSAQNYSFGGDAVKNASAKPAQGTGSGSDLPSGRIDSDANLVAAYTDSQGKYTLRGVPVNN